MRSVMQNQFARVEGAEVQRSVFDRSHGYTTAFDGGFLVPCLVDEILPGDSIQCSLTAFVRLNTSLAPLMDNLFFETFFFFVPNRLLWDNWQRFMGERIDPDDSIDYTVPVRTTAGYPENHLFDYMGIPPGVALTHNNLHGRAYNLIYREWFRHPSITDSPVVVTDDGPDGNNYTLLRRTKKRDYFTSVLPWPQRGDAVTLPLEIGRAHV